MRIVFMGTPGFALPTLEALVREEKEVVGVVTQPDRPKGRGHKLTPPPVKVFALNHKLPVYQPEKVENGEFTEALRRLHPDLIMVVAFGQILPPQVLSRPQFGCLNLHPSLLPKYRGAAPVNWAIIKGEEKTGVTTIYMNERLDSGDIILQEEVEILPSDTAGTLGDRLALIGARVSLLTLSLVCEGRAPRRAQDEKKAIFAPLLKPEDGKICWEDKAGEIRDKIRGLNPKPSAYTYYKGKLLKIWQAKCLLREGKEEEASLGGRRLSALQTRQAGRIIRIIKNEGLLVSAGEDDLLIQEVQPEGSRRMSANEFERGHRVKVGERLGD